MTILLSGGAKNGKSALAQDLVVRLASGGRRYYVATMIPVDGEDRERIRRHVEDREGLGFESIECGKNILSCLEGAEPEATFLLDSTTALLMNEMFTDNGAVDGTAGERCAAELVRFAAAVKHAVIVSDGIYSDAARYDEVTELYRRGLAYIDRELAQVCDTVVELAAGCQIIHKGELPT
ncbi:MAG: adenosylcobinamide kinase/adenosylcobinamide-phosphate guanylyltransferase [Ruminococcaceae bacterium]|jgi:adenosylcobinamide kinase/adenosylcobinamide-phosphate guanylyltransferase|nr:adenosylcobinamide kinase/adenosylcobinamide-phosphate guanylyltransferase [Oscillospiraceae bacterium]